MERDVRLADLPLDDFRQMHADLDESVYEILGVENAVRAFVSYGSTAPNEVKKQVARWSEKLGAR